MSGEITGHFMTTSLAGHFPCSPICSLPECWRFLLSMMTDQHQVRHQAKCPDIHLRTTLNKYSSHLKCFSIDAETRGGWAPRPLIWTVAGVPLAIIQ